MKIPEKYRWHIPTAALFFGFIFDFITLGRPDQIYGNVIIAAHFVLSGGSIILLNIRKARGEDSMILPLTTIMQFSFGSLASALLLFYGQSGTLSGNWPFLTLLIALLIGNERAHSRYALALFHVTIFYLLLFAYFALVIPIALDSIGTGVFLWSGVVSLIAIACFLGFLYVMVPKQTRANLSSLLWSILIVFCTMNALYVFNLIPPVPLALRSIDMYHHVSRIGADNYEVLYEPGPRDSWRKYFPFYSPFFRYVSGQNVYCFSSVFAPTGLSTPVRHRWQHFDEDTHEWVTEGLISFPIRGGRGEGYRGFTIKKIDQEGLWRCSVETERGLLIGRTSFRGIEVRESPQLVSEAR